jgi:hypothetical protein
LYKTVIAAAAAAVVTTIPFKKKYLFCNGLTFN